MKYDQRIVAFIDILGFKSLLDETVDKNDQDVEEKIDFVIETYKEIRELWDLDEEYDYIKKATATSKQISIFSDCIVISFKVEEPSEVYFTLLEIKWLIMRLLSRKILCRGAVSLGKCIHTPNYLFGPALVEAYILESKAAIYPRVILDSSVIEAGANFSAVHNNSIQEKEYAYSLLEQDSDGMYYIDYFYKARSELNDPEYDFPLYIENLGNVIRKGLMASSQHQKADLRVKYSWMRERYNRMVETVTQKKLIENLKKSGEPGLADFYQNLKKISPNKFSKKVIKGSL